MKAGPSRVRQLLCGGASRSRVCYQPGLPRLVYLLSWPPWPAVEAPAEVLEIRQNRRLSEELLRSERGENERARCWELYKIDMEASLTQGTFSANSTNPQLYITYRIGDDYIPSILLPISRFQVLSVQQEIWIGSIFAWLFVGVCSFVCIYTPDPP